MIIYIVEDDEIEGNVRKRALERKDHQVSLFENAEDALAHLSSSPCEVLITDIRLPGMDGIELLKTVRSKYQDLTTIVITAYGTIDLAVEAMKFGAYDFVTKPFPNDALLFKLDRIVKYRSQREENLQLKRELGIRSALENMVGESSKMKRVLELMMTAAHSDGTVLILGESGTGKEVAAQAIHSLGLKNKPFIAVSCAALPSHLLESELFGHERGAFTGAKELYKGRFELASGGTIYLDDIDAMPIELQAKLLRVLQEKEIQRLGSMRVIKVNVRVLASAKPNLLEQVKAGSFREDLYYRLNVFPLLLPPLRERKEDIPLLVRHFLKQIKQSAVCAQICRVDAIEPKALELLMNYAWPGNVRELENLVMRLCYLTKGDMITPADLPAEILENGGQFWKEEEAQVIFARIDKEKISFSQFIRMAEREYFSWALEKSRNNISLAAKLLGIPRTTLRDRLTCTAPNDCEDICEDTSLGRDDRSHGRAHILPIRGGA